MWLSPLFSHFANAQSPAWALARELFENGDWVASRREIRRVLLADPENREARILADVCSLKTGQADSASLERLEQAVEMPNVELETRALAAYEAGREYWRMGDSEKAYDLFVYAYRNTEDNPLFLRAGCSLFLLMKGKPELKTVSPSLTLQLKSSRRLFDWSLQQECMLPEEDAGTGILAKPGEWTVALYRSQVSPAIGMRCSCVPSCSEYFLLACRKHGLLGFPIQADRFFREPSIVQQRQNPIEMGGVIKYSDPLEAHDFWLGEGVDR